MNILTIRPDGDYAARPDTTLEKEERDFYLHEDFGFVILRKGLAVRISRAGKAIPARFARRYYDCCGNAMVIYCVSENSIRCDVDHSTMLDETTTPVSALPEERLLSIDGILSRITRWTSVRTGDVLIFEDEESVTLYRGDNFEGIRIL